MKIQTILSFCLIGILAACGRSEQAAPNANAGRPNAPAGAQALPPTQVLRAPLSMQSWVVEYSAVGTTSANESITLSAKVTETVARINFSDGETVRAGDVLVELTGRAEVAALKEAQAAYLDADRQYERLSNIVQQGTVTRAQLDTQGAARDGARARREAIRARLSDRVILAPFSGVTGFRQVSPGALVTPGTPITTLDDIDVLKLDFTVPESQLGAVNLDDLVLASSSAFPGREFSGKVASLDSRVDPSTRAVRVRARLDNKAHQLRPGMLMSVRLQAQSREAMTLAEIALQQQGAQAFVLRINAAGMAERTEVTIGARRRGEVEIVSGLSMSDVVIGEGAAKVRPGQPVQLLDAATAAPLTPALLPTPATPNKT
jgi:membrane fusion protein, multidrug efflux system